MQFIAGSLLLLAATLKARSPAESVALEAAYGLPQSASVALVAGEWLLGTLLLVGLWPRQTLGVALVVFTIFAGFSLYRGLSGAESCGCFGLVKVNPWFTFVLDGVISAALGRAWLRLSATPSANWSDRRRMAIASACALVGVPLLTWTASSQPARLAADGELVGSGGLVILEPEAWRGKPLPIAKHIFPSVDLSRGDWTLLLYHHDCPKCQEALPRYQHLADEFHALGSLEQVLLVEVPPFGRQSPPTGAAQAARLSDEREWFVQAPVEIRVREGRVVQSSLELPALTEYDAQLSDRVAFEP